MESRDDGRNKESETTDVDLAGERGKEEKEESRIRSEVGEQNEAGGPEEAELAEQVNEGEMGEVVGYLRAMDEKL